MPYSFANLTADKTVAQYKAEFDQIKRRSPEFSVNDMDDESKEPLIISAARRGYVNAVKAMLLDPSLNINAQDSHKRTALHYACSNKFNKQLQLIKELLRYKKQISDRPITLEYADISLEDEEGKKPFDYLPTPKTQQDIAQQLIYPVCECGRLDAFNQLCAKGVNIEEYESNESQKTPLHIAVSAGHKDIVSAIVEACPNSIHKLQDEGKSKNSVLHIAAYHLWPDIVTFLLSKGAKPREVNEAGQTPLMFAFETRDNDEPSLIKLGQIIETFNEIPYRLFSSMDVKTKITKYGESYLHIALRRRRPLVVNKYKLTAFILDQIPNEDAILNKKAGEDYDWKTPLQYAIDFNYELIPHLIKKGAKIELDDDENPTILHYIIKNHRQEAMKTLLDELLPESSIASSREKLVEWMAKKSKSKQQNILHLAARGDNKDLSQLLDKFDAQNLSPAFVKLINDVDSDSNTPLHNAIKAKNKDNVVKLLKYGALNNSPKDKELAVDIAIRESSYEILNVILNELTTIDVQYFVRNNNLKLLHIAAQIEGPEDYKGDTENKLNLLLSKIKEAKDFASLVTQEDENNNTPAHIALLSKKMRNFLVLEKTKVKLEATNKAKQSVSKLREDNIRLILKVQREMEERKVAHEKTMKNAESKVVVVKSTMRNSSSDDRNSASPAHLKTNGSKDIERRPSISGNPSSGHSTPVPVLQPPETAEPLQSEPASATPPSSSRSDMSGSDQPLISNEQEQQQGKNKEETQIAIDNLLYGGNNPLLFTTFKRLTNSIANSSFGQHIARNKYRYLIGGIITVLALAGFLALCVFCPPVAAKIAVLSLVMNVFIKTNLATAAAAWLKPVAQTIAVTLPVTVPIILSVVTLSITWGICKCNDFREWISSKLTAKSNIKTPDNSHVDYQAVATDDVRREQTILAAAPASLESHMASNVRDPETTVTTRVVQDASFWKAVQQFDEGYFQPFVKSMSFFCCGNAVDEDADLKKAPQQTQSDGLEKGKSSSPTPTVLT